MMKTTFFKYGFLTVKFHQKGVKYHLLGEKNRGNTAQKNQGGEIEPVFWQFSFFGGLIFYVIYSKTEYGRNCRRILARSWNGYSPYHVSPPIFQAELKQNLDARKQQVVEVDIPVEGDHDSAARLYSQVSYISLTRVYYIHGLKC